jgi:heme A synthase
VQISGDFFLEPDDTLDRLNPAMVAVHFLLSSAILAAAVTLHARAGEEDRPYRAMRASSDRLRTVLQSLARRAGVGPRGYVGGAVDLRAPAVPVHPEGRVR